MTDQERVTIKEVRKGLNIHPEEDGLYYKYRVFREPDNVPTHPVLMTAYYKINYELGGKEDPIGYAEEVTDFIFPLKPDTDHHARVALAAYAASVAEEKPRLSKDLFEVLRDLYDTGSEEENIL